MLSVSWILFAVIGRVAIAILLKNPGTDDEISISQWRAFEELERTSKRSGT